MEKPEMPTGTTAERIRSGKLPASANLEQKIGAIGLLEPLVHAFIETYFDDARRQAESIDEKIASKKPVGNLCGLVVAVKNVIAIKDRRLTCGSKILENYVAPYDAAVIERVRKADGVIIGSTNCDEFACGSDNTKSAFFNTVNPASFTLEEAADGKRKLLQVQKQDLFVPGGSSGGSAAAVAAGFCDLALGTDTGGSIRCPAAFCGVAGFKPTYGTVPRYGMADMAMSFEQIGALAPDAYGCALLLSVISGADRRDSTSSGPKGIVAVPGKGFGKAERRLRLGVPKEFFEGADKAVEKAVLGALKKAEAHGHELVEMSIPAVKYGIPAYYLLVYSEFASAMQKYDGLKYGAPADVEGDLTGAASSVRSATIGKECQRRIILGTYVTTKEHKDAWYTKALKARAYVRGQFDLALEKCDVLVGPTMPMAAWRIGEMNADPLQQYLADVLTVPANLCGLPAGSLSAGKAGKLPVGLQVIGRRGSDAKVLQAMAAFERLLGESKGN